MLSVIIRKPYAFLIKHFRMIHLFMFACVLFVSYKSTALLNFFNSYVKNGYYSYINNLAGSLINFYLFLSIIIIILLGLIIYILLKWKDKKRTLYIFICCFYLILFVAFIIYFGFLNVIESNVIDERALRTYRDVVLILNLPQYFFVIMTFIRAIGFDIKKFDFKKDIEDLEIDTSDYEEVEINFGQDNYKIRRKARRAFREFKYYILENKFFFAVICVLLFVSFSFAIYLNFEVYNKNYNETELFSIDGINFKVLASYASNVDYRGNTILEDKKYIVILLDIVNVSDERKTLKTENLKLIVNNKQYSVSFSKNNYFIDLGEGYYNQILYPGEEKQYILVYEIPESESTTSYVFRLMSEINYFDGKIRSNHKDVVINPVNYLKNDYIYDLNLGSFVDLSLSTLSDTSAIVLDYEFNDSYVVYYDYCVLENCYTAQKIIEPDIVGKIPKTLIRLEIDFNNNTNLYIYKYLKSNVDLVSMFGKIVYVIDGVKKSTYLETFDYDFLTGKYVYAEVPEEILNASSIILNITVRNAVFNIKLK